MIESAALRKRQREALRPRLVVMRCGWCKGFIHSQYVGDMQRYVHDEKPRTEHEVLPYSGVG